MYDILQVTADYSNAVLLAVLPYVSDFATKLDLPVQKPVTPAQVREFKCSWRSDQIGGSVRLLNGFQFSFVDGRVALYRSPKSYYSLQDPTRLPEFYGEVRVSESQAVGIAHEAIRKLGYSDAMLAADRSPLIVPPPKVGTNTVPRYRIKWFDPHSRDPADLLPTIDLEVDASTRAIRMLTLFSPSTFRPQPKVNVRAPVRAHGPETRPVGEGRKLLPVHPAYAQAFLVAILPQFCDYVRKGGFSVQLPITTNAVDMAHYTCGVVEGDPCAFVDLKTGARFVYRHGQVVAFYAPDVMVLPGEDQKSLARFVGPINVTSNAAVALVRETVRRLGYSEKVLHMNEPPMDSGGPPRWGTGFIARYFLNWKESHEGDFRVVAEVDATAKTLKSLFINDNVITNVWRIPPRIDVPFEPAPTDPLSRDPFIGPERPPPTP